MSSQAITDALRRWIVEQAQAGCTPESVLEAMKASGWKEDVAIEAMEQTLTGFLKSGSTTRAPSASGSASTTALQSTSSSASGPAVATSGTTVDVAQRLPEPSLEGQPSVVRALDREVKVALSMKNPRVVVFADLLSEQECDALIALARPRLARSETLRHADGGSEVNEARTSQGMFFARGETELIKRIEERIGHLLNWPVDHGEGLQILHYQPGAEYRPHYDYFDPAQPGTAAVLKRGGQRVGTLVMYLNTPDQGGGTTFPDVGLEVAPIRGHAVFFSYDRPDPSTRTLHGGAPVIRGEKWVATKWLRTGVFT